MKHEIDLEKYSIRTDLAIDTLENENIKNGFTKTEEKYDDIIVTEINIDLENSKLINKKPGYYVTIGFQDVTDEDNQQKLKHIYQNEIKKIIPKLNKEDLVLVVGLGNNSCTPDSLGPEVIKKINITNHLYELNLCSNDYQKVAAITPGVTGATGIETSDQVKSIVEFLKPKLVIVIDSLASSSIERLNKTIQITTTGIHPGSGIGNSRKELSKETLGVDVIAIGVPTVVDAVSIVSDTINYMHKHYSFSKYNLKQSKYKLTTGNINYLKENVKLNDDDKKTLLGLIGSLNEEELKGLISEVLSPIGYNLMVTPKEIDEIINVLVHVIAEGLNNFFSN